MVRAVQKGRQPGGRGQGAGISWRSNISGRGSKSEAWDHLGRVAGREGGVRTLDIGCWRHFSTAPKRNGWSGWLTNYRTVIWPIGMGVVWVNDRVGAEIVALNNNENKQKSCFVLSSSCFSSYLPRLCSSFLPKKCLHCHPWGIVCGFYHLVCGCKKTRPVASGRSRICWAARMEAPEVGRAVACGRDRVPCITGESAQHGATLSARWTGRPPSAWIYRPSLNRCSPRYIAGSD